MLTSEEEAETLDKLASRDDILIVGFSLMSVQIAHCLRVIRELKEKNPKTKISTKKYTLFEKLKSAILGSNSV